MTTHRPMIPHVFAIPELVFQILDYEPVVCPGDIFRSEVRTKRTHAQTLLSTALTCRDLSDIALSALWREMNGLLPLLKLLPGYRTVAEGSHEEKRVRNSVRLSSTPYKPNDLRRFKYYAHKIRVLNLSSPPTYPGTTPPRTIIHPSAFTSLSSLTSILPLLQVLHYGNDWTSYSINELSHLITPSLTQLSLTLPRANETLLLDLRGVLAQNPGIPKVELSGHIPVQQAFISTLKDFTLTALKIDFTRLVPGLLDTLGTFTTLRDLTLVLAGSERFVVTNISSSSPLLPLETLRITGENDEISTMLDHISPSTLQVLDVEYWYSFPVGGKIDVAQHVREANCWMRHLDRFTKVKEINISLALFTDWDECGSQDPLCISELFHSFPQNLMPTTLKIRVPRWIDIQGPSSDVFWSIWESVTTLDLAYIYDDCSYADPDPRYVPCTVLETISQQCKSIYYLRISLSDEDISRSSKGFPVGFENRGLQMLDLSNSRIYNPTAVSCYLRKIFPELKQIVHLDPVVHRTFQL